MSAEKQVVALSEHGFQIAAEGDVLEAVALCAGGAGLLIDESDLSPGFFDLRTGLAGAVMQKLVNYRVRAAIVVPDPGRHGDRVAELAREHATHPVIRFVRTRAEGEAWLSG